MNTISKEQFAQTYGSQALTQFQPLASRPQGYTQRLASSVSQDVNKRTDTVGRIQQSNASPISKAVQTFGQGAGMAAHAVETAVGEIPGVKQGIEKVGQGINALSNTAPVRKIADHISNNTTVQELT